MKNIEKFLKLFLVLIVFATSACDLDSSNGNSSEADDQVLSTGGWVEPGEYLSLQHNFLHW
jgi:hypothetical protein